MRDGGKGGRGGRGGKGGKGGEGGRDKGPWVSDGGRGMGPGGENEMQKRVKSAVRP